MKRRFLVFDLDGTLVDSLPDIAAALNTMLATLGAPALPSMTVRRLIGDGAAALVAGALRESGLSADLVEEGHRLFLDRYEATPVAGSRPYSGVVRTLATLRATDYRMGVCTNKPQRATLAILAGLGLDGFFDAVVGGDLLPVRKPDPRHLLATIAALGGAAPEGVMIGDNENDAMAAQAAGMPVILMRYGYARRPLEELGAAMLLEAFSQLPDALARLGSALP